MLVEVAEGIGGGCTSLTNKTVVRAAPSVRAEITIPGNA